VDELTEMKLDEMKTAAEWLVNNGMSREQVETEFYLALGDEVDESPEPQQGTGKPKRQRKPGR